METLTNYGCKITDYNYRLMLCKRIEQGYIITPVI